MNLLVRRCLQRSDKYLNVNILCSRAQISLAQHYLLVRTSYFFWFDCPHEPLKFRHQQLLVRTRLQQRQTIRPQPVALLLTHFLLMLQQQLRRLHQQAEQPLQI